MQKTKWYVTANKNIYYVLHSVYCLRIKNFKKKIDVITPTLTITFHYTVDLKKMSSGLHLTFIYEKTKQKTWGQNILEIHLHSSF